MRQRLGKKKIAKYARETGLPVVTALTRGNTDHRVDLFLADGSRIAYWPKTGQIETPADRARAKAEERLRRREIGPLKDHAEFVAYMEAR